jgi:hypothetical protein
LNSLAERTCFSQVDIDYGGQSLAKLERKRSESVLDRNYPVAKDHYQTMLELRDEFNADQRQKEANRQQNEQNKLAASFMHLDNDLEIEWAGRMRASDEDVT